jgi:hypothetical protein
VTVDEPRLALTKVRVNRRPGNLYVYDDRLVIETVSGDQEIPMSEVERVATRRSVRGARLLLALSNGDIVQVHRLSVSSTRFAHRTIVAIARSLH